MRDYPRFEDLGLVDDDRTEDLRPRNESAPGVVAATAEGDQNSPTAK